MGLDITAYHGLSYTDSVRYDHVKDVFVNAETNVEYSWESFVYLQPSLFTEQWPQTNEGQRDGVYHYYDKFRFYAGAYSGYAEYRTMLAQSLGYTSHKQALSHMRIKGGAFHRQIVFPDSEGIIWTKGCAELAEDHAHHRATFELFVRAETRLDIADYFQRTYDLFHAAFLIGSVRGCVWFH